jgi:hypothetical protein
MAVRIPRRRLKDRRKTPVAPGRQPVPGEPGGTEMPLPHERDQTLGQTDPQPNEVIRQAKKDIDNGLVDTDLRTTPGLDAPRREQLLKPKRSS